MLMSKFIGLILAAVAVAAAFAAGRWTAPAQLITTYSPASSAIATPNKSCSLPPVVVKAPAPFEGVAAADLLKKLQTNKTRMPSAATQDEQRQLLEALAAVDPVAAMAQAQQLKGDRKAQAVAAVLAAWGTKDPEAAWKWVAPENIYQYDQLLEVFGKNDPEVAARFASELAGSRPELTQEVYLAALMGITHAGGYGTARQLVESANISSEDRNVLMNYVAGAWATYDPQAAAHWVMGQVGDAQNSALIGLGESWSTIDPPAAANFAARLIGSPQRQLLLQQSLSKWLAEDVVAATNWLASAEDHQDYDQAIHTLSTLPNLMRDQAPTALAWSERIYDTNLRIAAVQQILGEMKVKDPVGAVIYARNAPRFTQAQRTQLMNSLETK
jgi:hypothetical protein